MEFDSLISIIRPNHHLIIGGSDSTSISHSEEGIFKDLFVMNFEEVVQKHQLDSLGQREFLLALSITADIAKVHQMLNEAMTQLQAVDTTEDVPSGGLNIEFTPAEQRIVDSLEQVIWESKKVKKYIQEVQKNSNGQRTLVGYIARSDDEIFYRLAEDNGFSFVTHLIFLFSFSSNSSGAIHFYDTINERYIEFKTWEEE